jgi:hypothetical protein
MRPSYLLNLPFTCIPSFTKHTDSPHPFCVTVQAKAQPAILHRLTTLDADLYPTGGRPPYRRCYIARTLNNDLHVITFLDDATRFPMPVQGLGAHGSLRNLIMSKNVFVLKHSPSGRASGASLGGEEHPGSERRSKIAKELPKTKRVELAGVEPATPCLQSRCSTS